MKILLPICFLLFLTSVGCKKESAITIQDKKEVAILDSLSVENVKIDLLKLSAESKEEISVYQDFTNLQNLVKTMRNSNPYYISKYADSMNVLVRIFKENLTQDYNMNTISSRMVVLYTKSNLLLEVSNKNPPAEKLINANTNLIKAYNSLVIQLNELSLAIPEEIEKELLRINDIKKDSIPEAEK